MRKWIWPILISLNLLLAVLVGMTYARESPQTKTTSPTVITSFPFWPPPPPPPFGCGNTKEPHS